MKLSDEKQSADFDPFALDVLPDLPGQTDRPSPFQVPRPIPASLVAEGYNGNNIPINAGEGIETELGKRREGRMSTFTADRAATVIEAIEDGDTMREAAALIGVDRKTLWAWMQLCPEFRNQVAQAREIQGHASADNAVKILDEVTIDEDNPKAAMAELRKAEQRARIRMELAKCFNFKQYGDKKQNLNMNLNADVCPVDLSKYGS